MSSLSSYGEDIFSLESLKSLTFQCREIIFQNPYLRLRLETLLARLAKLANEILEARWKDIQRMKICKEIFQNENLIAILGMAGT